MMHLRRVVAITGGGDIGLLKTLPTVYFPMVELSLVLTSGHGRSKGLHGYIGDMDKAVVTSLTYYRNATADMSLSLQINFIPTLRAVPLDMPSGSWTEIRVTRYVSLLKRGLELEVKPVRVRSLKSPVETTRLTDAPAFISRLAVAAIICNTIHSRYKLSKSIQVLCDLSYWPSTCLEVGTSGGGFSSAYKRELTTIDVLTY
ncbi:hypothetical protein Tco_1148114 [Tanacetum coccineum]